MRITLFLMACLVPLAGYSAEIDPAHLPGNWVGTGRYYEVKLQRQADAPRFDLTIGPDLTLTGTVGTARLVPTRPRASGERVDYFVLLEGSVAQHAALRSKDHLLILITQLAPDSFEADFHLKSSFGFDFTMHPGALHADRKAP